MKHNAISTFLDIVRTQHKRVLLFCLSLFLLSLFPLTRLYCQNGPRFLILSPIKEKGSEPWIEENLERILQRAFTTKKVIPDVRQSGSFVIDLESYQIKEYDQKNPFQFVSRKEWTSFLEKEKIPLADRNEQLEKIAQGLSVDSIIFSSYFLDTLSGELTVYLNLYVSDTQKRFSHRFKTNVFGRVSLKRRIEVMVDRFVFWEYYNILGSNKIGISVERIPKPQPSEPTMEKSLPPTFITVLKGEKKTSPQVVEKPKEIKGPKNNYIGLRMGIPIIAAGKWTDTSGITPYVGIFYRRKVSSLIFFGAEIGFFHKRYPNGTNLYMVPNVLPFQLALEFNFLGASTQSRKIFGGLKLGVGSMISITRPSDSEDQTLYFLLRPGFNFGYEVSSNLFLSVDFGVYLFTDVDAFFKTIEYVYIPSFALQYNF